MIPAFASTFVPSLRPSRALPCLHPRPPPTAMQHVPPPSAPPPALHAAVDFRHLLPGTQRLLPAPSAAAAPPPAPAPSSFVAAAVRAVGPAVVRIDTEKSVSGPMAAPPGLEGLFDDPGMKKFFSDEFGAQMMNPRKRTERSLGSGFIVSEDGIIVTNAHVVKGADKIVVTLTDGRTFNGQLSGTDELLDLAVVKIDSNKPTSGSEGRKDGSSEEEVGDGAATPPRLGFGALGGLGVTKTPLALPVAKLGSSSALSVGDWAIAVGNPHGLNNTVTLGIVSSLNRSAAEVGIPEKRMNLIQTSAPLNAGNSGGVIANDRGEVVGVAVAVRANAEGIGFAIPIDRVKEVVAELANGKTIAHPFLGIKMLTLTPDYARENNNDPNAPAVIPEVNGAIVMHVIPESPAAKPAGLRRFDIIVGIDGKKCQGVKDVQAIVERANVGQRIRIQVIRGGDLSKPIDVSVETGDLASTTLAPKVPTIIPVPIDPRM